MTFSLRLTADLTLALAARSISTKPRSYPPILRLSPDINFQTGAAALSIGGHQAGKGSSQPGALVPRFRSPIIWIAGAEPLDSPEVARFANALAASGRSVFLETSGTSLKRRLHEFQPSSRFYFAVRFDVLESSDGQRNSRDGAFRVGLEAIRMARLAGFFTCARLVLHPDTAAGELEQLRRDISKLDVDGFLITSAALDPGMEKKVTRLRRRLLGRRWALLSSLLDSSAVPVASGTSLEIERQPLSESRPGDFEEGAEAG
jgi:radical SAM family protein